MRNRVSVRPFVRPADGVLSCRYGPAMDIASYAQAAAAGAAPSVTDVLGVAFSGAGLGVAVIAAVYAWLQWLQAKEQYQPHVGVYLEPDPEQPEFAMLTVKNFGPTPATDVRFSFLPALKRSGVEPPHDDVEVPDMPYLAPGQTWSTWWDSGPRRRGSDLPDEYTGLVTYLGLGGKTRSHVIGLNFSLMKALVYRQRRSN